MADEANDNDALEADETQQQAAADDAAKVAELEAARKLRSENANLRKRLKEIEAEREQATKTEAEKAREAGRAEARAEVLKERALDKVETKAAKLFADPEDARALLADKVDDFIADGKVDTEAIDAALADLLKRKPHLGADQRRFKGSADSGARESGKAGELTRSDVERLFREGKYAEIEQARLEGRIKFEKKPSS